MAQPVAVMAFRKRLKKRGYFDISILWKSDLGKYHVIALEPLAKMRVELDMDILEMIGFR